MSKLHNQLRKEIIRMNSTPDFTPTWVLENANSLAEEAVTLIDTAVENGKIKYIDEKVINAAAFRVVSRCF